MAVKVGLVGLGMMGTMHFKAYQDMEGAQLVAVCEARAERFESGSGGVEGNIASDEAKQIDFTGIQTYTDFDKFVAEADVDMIDICVPTFLHAEHTVRAFEAGRHVFCEKPMARNSDQCRTMIDAADFVRANQYLQATVVAIRSRYRN